MTGHFAEVPSVRVVHGLRQPTPRETTDTQVLHEERLVLAHKSCGELMVEVPAAIRYSRVEPRDFRRGLGAIIRPGLFTGRCPLGFREAAFLPTQKPRCLDLLAFERTAK